MKTTFPRRADWLYAMIGVSCCLCGASCITDTDYEWYGQKWDATREDGLTSDDVASWDQNAVVWVSDEGDYLVVEGKTIGDAWFVPVVSAKRTQVGGGNVAAIVLTGVGVGCTSGSESSPSLFEFPNGRYSAMDGNPFPYAAAVADSTGFLEIDTGIGSGTVRYAIDLSSVRRSPY